MKLFAVRSIDTGADKRYRITYTFERTDEEVALLKEHATTELGSVLHDLDPKSLGFRSYDLGLS